MTEILIWSLGGVLATLLALLTWIGARVHDRLDQINTTLIKIDSDLTEKISRHDVRLSVIESKLEVSKR